ncbi:MAG: phosphoglucosamine mutase, partial [Acidimicrobiia bacterium]|nr:phosphoglucosamine mutase [Acidimicrobiia bacterium]
MSRRLFGTDGVRGVANADITPELAVGLARSAGALIDGVAVIGRDTRRSGPMLAAALHAGFNSVGVDTVDLGIVPVGAVSRLTREASARYGVMVSASHNPAPDNGIKFFGRDGAKLDDDSEKAIEDGFARTHEPAIGHLIGLQTVMSDAVDRYVGFLRHKAQYSLRGVELAIDCANGAAFAAAPQLFDALKADVEVYAADPDGTNINEGCGATHPEVLAAKASGRIGLAFDGDADRLIAVDENGEIVNGDVLMAIVAKHLKDNGKLAGNTVVATVMSNLGFRQAMKQAGIDVIETKVGDRYVLEAMKEHKA